MAQRIRIDRSNVHKKYAGHCGYCGKSITLKEMQVDHMNPIWSAKDNTVHDISNLMPSCRRCNHYKRADNLEQFRLSMKGLHKRLSNIYINNVAVDFGIIDIKPFDGVFYFEKLKHK